MNNMIISIKRFFILCVFAFSHLMLVSCGSGAGNGEVGEQDDAAPQAKIEVLGVSNQLTDPTTRSGTDVILSGQNSVGVDDPVLRYQWQQIDNSGYQVVLHERTNNTVAFTTPALPADLDEGITLRFELTITDADGVTATSQTSVKVVPVADPNRYLVHPQLSEAVRIYIAAQPGSTLNANTPVSIIAKPIYTWRDRAGSAREVALDEKTFTTNLTSGRVGEVLSAATAFVTLPMPDLDMDDINQYFQGAERAGRLEIDKLDTVSIEWQLSLQTTSGQTISAYLVNPATTQIISPENLLVPGAGVSLQANSLLNNTTQTIARISIEKLRQALSLESRLSAENYIKCIDPLNRAANFSDWLAQAGFDAANANDIHTKYINNYDLGFGRDMHIRTDENGNVYSYVANYNNLENTISNRNAFAIVVMEYSPAPTGNCGDGTFTDPVSGKKLVKFYTFVPDELKGGFKRATSMNFDGRGEKYLPGSCTACHGGKTNAELFNSTAAIDAVAADLDAGFMPWDLDAFLYTHASDSKLTDPAYASFAKTTPPAGNVTEKFSREQQEPLFKQQNQATLHTYTQDIHKLKRFETAIKLIRGWYASSAEIAEMDAMNFGTEEVPLSDDELRALQAKLKNLPAGNYNGNFILQGWRQDATVDELYNQVFDRHCRLCHVQMNKQPVDFDSYNEFINNPWLVDYVYAQGAMPMSRLTMDRFWNNFNGGTSAAELLREHLNQVKNANIADAAPGLPQARITQEANPDLPADLALNFDQQLILDGSGSYLSDTFSWKVNSNIVSQAPILSMDAGAPGSEYSVTLETQRNGFTSSPVTRRIRVNNYTPQFANTLSASLNEGGSVQIDLLRSICADEADSLNCRNYFGDIRAGERPRIELEQLVVNGQLTWVNESTGIISFRSTAAVALGNGRFAFKLVDSFGEKSAVINVQVSVNALAAPQIGGNDVCTLAAITSANANNFPASFGSINCPNPLANDLAAPGLSLSIQSISNASQQGGSLSLVNGVIRYTPPKFFVGTDSFNYTVVDNSLSNRTAVGSVTITLTPSMTYTNLKTRFMTNCAISGCHQPAPASAGPNWTVYGTLINRLDDTVGRTGANLNLNANTTVAQILDTWLFIYACSSDSHFGANQLCEVELHGEEAPTSRLQLNTMGRDILQWIEEGARNN
jgi:hypothetical protein